MDELRWKKGSNYCTNSYMQTLKIMFPLLWLINNLTNYSCKGWTVSKKILCLNSPLKKTVLEVHDSIKYFSRTSVQWEPLYCTQCDTKTLWHEICLQWSRLQAEGREALSVSCGRIKRSRLTCSHITTNVTVTVSTSNVSYLFRCITTPTWCIFDIAEVSVSIIITGRFLWI